MTEVPWLLREGMYLTDGKRLVQIKRVLDDSVTIEAGPTDAPDYGALAKTVIGAQWKIVDVPEDDGVIDRWLLDHYPVKKSLQLDSRVRCGCSRCLQSLGADEVHG